MSKQTISEEDDETSKFDLDKWLLENWEGLYPMGHLLIPPLLEQERKTPRILQIWLKVLFTPLKSTLTQRSLDGGDLDVGSDVIIPTYLETASTKESQRRHTNLVFQLRNLAHFQTSETP